jgi:cytochrome d ubiquinol oxidase subunit I
MAMSLAFHIVFAVVGMAMPLLMLMAEGLWLKTGDRLYRTLAERWAKGAAIMFAVGAVSGTALSFELGLLWPKFMEHAGPIIGMPFSLEGLAFFLEAIFLGLYFYGWDRISRTAHFLCGVAVLVSGTASGILVVCANAWMNHPTGFDLVNGLPTNIDPLAAMMNPGSFSQALHMTIAAFQSVGFAVAGIHAFMLLKEPGNRFHHIALNIALLVGGVSALIQPFSGDISARLCARTQPIKLAAMESHFVTERGAPLIIGGWPDTKTGTVSYAIEIPYGLSLLAFHDPYAEVKGLNDFPRDEWPPVPIVHVAFQVMVGLGTAMAALAVFCAYRVWRKKGLPLRLIVLSGPMGLVALEAGWVVTEVGRQPWIVYGWMRTAEAVTPVPYLIVPFTTFSLVYLGLALTTLSLLRAHVLRSPHEDELA